jgi:two-component system, NarL family, response regulator YdfI
VTRVVIVTSSPLLRAGLESVLGVAAWAESLKEAAALEADVIVVDWDRDEAGELLEFATESPPLLVLASEPQPSWLSDALRAGVRGFLSREASGTELVAAVEAVAAGLVVLQPQAIEHASVRAALPAQAEALSPREIEVLRWMAEGSSNKTIAWKLGISEHTVKFHVNSILSKMGAGSRTEAVMAGLRRGLIPL